MSTTRLTFLYPHLLRSAWRSESAGRGAVTATARRGQPRSLQKTILPSPFRCRQAADFATGAPREQSSFAPRVGKGVEPTLAREEEAREKEAGPDTAEPTEFAKLADRVIASAQTPEKGDPPPRDAEGNTTVKTNSTEPSPSSSPPPAAQTEAEAAAASQQQQPQEPQPSAQEDGTKDSPMGAILHMGPPSAHSHKPPHLRPPRHVHHFDSYSLVKQLSGGGYTAAQSITAMKAVRALLAQNLDVAQDGLVSKSDVENETYLFRAACSELSAETRNRRRGADEQSRQRRTLLQHEVDILAQSLNQELRSLEDNVRGMFNDRKMAVREEQKSVDSKTQQITYKISVELNSDVRSEIEGVRWVLIRRSVLGIILMAIITLATLRYGSYLSHQAKEAEQKAREAAARNRADGNGKVDQSAAPEAVEILTAS